MYTARAEGTGKLLIRQRSNIVLILMNVEEMRKIPFLPNSDKPKQLGSLEKDIGKKTHGVDDANYSHVLAVRGDPLDGWYISDPGVSIGWYPSHLAGLLKGIKLRVVNVPGGDSERIGPG
ncbi:hypothetical protein AVEN_19975-1 [Araneus ventricosus]|uniref:Uncharacterized protein n=1 Tax=Araneus ventricosus TaxID=182803 RepID=A0A4Y2RB92_ARAVE|nr:hypothetical protein AVEN_19975-1 [Araneus ventricosus]